MVLLSKDDHASLREKQSCQEWIASLCFLEQPLALKDSLTVHFHGNDITSTVIASRFMNIVIYRFKVSVTFPFVVVAY